MKYYPLTLKKIKIRMYNEMEHIKTWLLLYKQQVTNTQSSSADFPKDKCIVNGAYGANNNMRKTVLERKSKDVTWVPYRFGTFCTVLNCDLSNVKKRN